MQSISGFDAAAHAREMRTAGHWIDKSFDECLLETIAATPDKLAIVADRAGDDRLRRVTYAELGNMVSRAAAGLREFGIDSGDVVAAQLPNWWQFVVVSLACARIGAVLNPLMPIFRERELSYMLGFAEAKLFIVPKSFRGFDHEQMARSLQATLPKLKGIVVVDGEGPNSFDRCLLGNAKVEPRSSKQMSSPWLWWRRPPLSAAAERIDPDALAVLMYTSGTTGSPKGVMHTTNTLMTCTNKLSGRFGLTADDVVYVCSPVGHMTGYAAGVLLALRLGATMVLQDIWDARRGVSLMAAEGATYTAASSPFLSDICEAVAAGAPRPTRLRSFLCGGAPIPPILIHRAASELNVNVCSLWGMTESLSSTLTEPARAHEKSATTDGRPLDGTDVRIVDFDGRPVPAGQTGRLLVRGAQMFIGYYKRPELPTFDKEGWFDTGDLAYMDNEGYIRINGRTKDIVIRGGENVPVAEIESLLCEHPAVLAAAIVGYPDARLGERACAFLVLRPGHSLDLGAVQNYMSERKVAKQYWPERIEVVQELPRTPSGKIQKFALREIAKHFAHEVEGA